MSRPTLAVASKKRMKKTADDLCRDIVRARGICEAFGFDGVECDGRFEWAHIIVRNYLQVRWDIRETGQVDNANCLCHAHHWHFFNHPIAEERFHRSFLGDDVLAALKLRAEQTMGTPIDYDAVLARLKEAYA